MKYRDWEPVYERILEDMGYDRGSDEASARVLKAVTVNSDLVTEDEARHMFSSTATVMGGAPCLEEEISSEGTEGTVVASGSAVSRLMDLGIVPGVVVTDLDGPIEAQIECSRRGSLTFIHAHGDNVDLVRRYAPEFKGPVILTTQSRPDTVVANYGGFTDGDRAVCICQEFGVRKVVLRGFDALNPYPKEGSDPSVKMKKLGWASAIIEFVSQDIDVVR